MKNIVIAHISDTYNNNSFEIPECDIFIHSGDLTNFGSVKETEKVLNHIKSQKNKFKLCIIIAGNHDRYFLKNDKFEDFIIINKPQIVEYNGLRVFCYNSVTPIPPLLQTSQQRKFLIEAGFKNGKWCFEKEDKERKDELKEFINFDIMISHAPPTNLANGYYNKQGCCYEIRDKILEEQPKYVFCGHVHELNGVYKIGDTNVVVSCNTMRTFEILL